MKRIFTLVAWLAATLGASATDYQDRLQVTVNGVSTIQQATISVVQQENGLYTLTLKNFVLEAGESSMGVGNITLSNIEGKSSDGRTLIVARQDINITEGDRADVAVWAGPMLGPIPVDLTAVLTDDELYTVIDIDMQASLQQTIKVIFGTGGYQIRNSDFETFHTVAEKYEEPNAWHSFESASGQFAPLAGHHLESSTEVRPGSAGTKSVRLYATSLFGIIANGTMTTGRMNAGSMSAEDKVNCAYLDMSSDKKDANDDPFYSRLNGKPDSIAVWVKFKQGKAVADHPYATMSASITDGTYYQDPEDKEYSNVAAKASYNTIATNGEQWQRISAPFTYYRNGVTPKAILVTLSTNADAGKGSNGDEMLVDDLELIYNARLASLRINGQAVEGFNPDQTDYTLSQQAPTSASDIEASPDGAGATVSTTVTTEGETTKAVVTVTSGDLVNKTVYTLVFNNVATESIGNATHAAAATTLRRYNLSGQPVATPRQATVVIEQRSDGTTRKIAREK